MLREFHTAAFYSTAKLLDKVKKVKRYLKAHIKVSIISNAVKARKWPEKTTRTEEIIMVVRIRHKPSRNGDFTEFCRASCTPAACAELKHCCCTPCCDPNTVKWKGVSTLSLLGVV